MGWVKIDWMGKIGLIFAKANNFFRKFTFGDSIILYIN
jgi:hypothetical protein